MSLIDLASLVLAPTATKEGKVYSAIPDTGDGDMTFSRGSAATRVNSAGLIEKERANFLLQSNTFDTTWTNSGSTETSGQSGYYGSNDAWLLTKIAGSGRLQQAITKSGVCTLSVYAKAGTLDWIWIRAIDGVDNPNVFFDLQNGVKGITGGTNYIDSSIEQVGATGWYRLKLVFSQGITEIRIYPADDDGDVSGTSGNILIQDAMLNEGLVAQPYIETTTTAVSVGITDDVPRVDYSGGGCPSLLLEPQRSNLVTQSEYFGDSSWGKSRASITQNATTSPEGIDNAQKIVTNNNENTGYIVNRPSLTSGTTYTASFFIKQGENQYTKFWSKITGSFNGAVINLSNGAITLSTFATLPISEDYGNGWWRVSYTETAASGADYPLYIEGGTTSNGAALTGNGVDGVYVYGAMVEAGSYSTSYIPTYGTSTTRVADVCSKTGISELIGQTEGTLFFEGIIEGINPTTARRVVSLSDGTNSNLFQVINLDNSLDLRYELRSANSSVFTINDSNAFSLGQKFKFAFAYADNNFAFYVNGNQVGTSTSGSVIATSVLRFARGDGANPFEGANSQLLLFPTRLTNDELQELTK